MSVWDVIDANIDIVMISILKWLFLITKIATIDRKTDSSGLFNSTHPPHVQVHDIIIITKTIWTHSSKHNPHAAIAGERLK